MDRTPSPGSESSCDDVLMCPPSSGVTLGPAGMFAIVPISAVVSVQKCGPNPDGRWQLVALFVLVPVAASRKFPTGDEFFCAFTHLCIHRSFIARNYTIIEERVAITER